MEQTTSKAGIVALVFGIIGLFFVPLYLGIGAVIASAVGLSDPNVKKGLPIAGLVLGLINVCFGLIKGFGFGMWI